MASPDFDRSEWIRRDERRAQANAVFLAHVRGRLPQLREILAEHGVREAYFFGSVASGAVHPESDVDLAVAGCPPQSFYRLGSRLERALERSLDLLDLDGAPADLVAEVYRTGQRIFAREESSDR